METTQFSVTIACEDLDAARELELPVEYLAERAVRRAVHGSRTLEEREAIASTWAEDNAEALAELRAWNAENELPLERWQTLRVPGIGTADTGPVEE